MQSELVMPKGQQGDYTQAQIIDTLSDESSLVEWQDAATLALTNHPLQSITFMPGLVQGHKGQNSLRGVMTSRDDAVMMSGDGLGLFGKFKKLALQVDTNKAVAAHKRDTKVIPMANTMTKVSECISSHGRDSMRHIFHFRRKSTSTRAT